MPESSSNIRFGAFDLDLRSRELRKHGLRIRLGDQPFQVLRMLVERPDEVVTREQLRQTLWPADTFVDFDVSLNSAVRKLRDALGDSADNPHFIETLPKRGYRFVAPLKTAPPPAPIPEASTPPPRIQSRWLAATLALVGAVALLAWYAPSRTGGPRPIDPEANELYEKGLAAGGQQTPEAYRTAIGYYQQAVKKQPDFAAAYAALAEAQLQFLYIGNSSPREVVPKAEAAAREAIRLDDSLALGHRTLATVLRTFYWKWDEADREIERARVLTRGQEGRPLGAAALSRNNRFEEAIAEAEDNRQRDPLSFNAYMNVAQTYRAAGQYDRAVAEFRRALKINPSQNRAHFQLGVTFVAMRRIDDAIAELETAVRSSKGNPRFKSYLGYAYAKAGRIEDARRIVGELEAESRLHYVSSFGIALIHDALGDKDEALAAFDRAYQDRAVEFSQMALWPKFETIAGDARFVESMRVIQPRP